MLCNMHGIDEYLNKSIDQKLNMYNKLISCIFFVVAILEIS